jgi:adenosylcobinamide-GDP ribazoletransferase
VPLSGLGTAFMLLTRLPVARLTRGDAPADLARTVDLAHAVWAFPLVGLAVGALGGAVYWGVHRLGVPPLVGAGWVLAATMLATGALHDDGLADTADGFGGGVTPDRKLEIMRDSRIGSYGVLALLLSVVLRAGCIAALEDPRRVMAVLIAAGALGRGGMLLPLFVSHPARPDGLAASLGDTPRGGLLLGIAIAVAAPFLTVPVSMGFGAVALAAGVALGMARLADHQIGGYTGDVLGAVEIITECAVLTAATALIR